MNWTYTHRGGGPKWIQNYVIDIQQTFLTKGLAYAKSSTNNLKSTSEEKTLDSMGVMHRPVPLRR